MFGTFLIGCLIIGGVSVYEHYKQVPSDKQLMRVDLGGVSKFLAFIAMVTVIRLCAFDLAMEFAPEKFSEMIYQSHYTLMQTPLWRLGLVFWEDAFFAMPMVYVIRKYSKWIWIPFVIAMSAMFGMGHGYQGMWAIAVTAVYPYFISYKYGTKNGFGTVMCCHIIYDVVTYFTLYLAPYLMH